MSEASVLLALPPGLSGPTVCGLLLSDWVHVSDLVGLQRARDSLEINRSRVGRHRVLHGVSTSHILSLL